MFANTDSVRMPADVRRGLEVLLGEAAALGMAPAVPRLHIIEGEPAPRAELFRTDGRR
jgi:hypothetical protein